MLTRSMTRGRTAVALVGLMALLGVSACGSNGSGNGGSGGSNATGTGGGSPGSGGSPAAPGTGGVTGNPATGGATGNPGSGGSRVGTGGATGNPATGGADGRVDAGAGTGGARPDAGANTDGPAITDAGGVSPTMSFFVTSETSTTGNLGGLAMADAKCARLAAAAGVTGKTWKAYLSTAAENARTRIGAGPWFNIRGVMIAANLVQLHEESGMKNNITQNTALTDKGQTVPGRLVRPAGAANEHDILTGSLMNGMVNTGFTCGAWDSTQGSSFVGHVDRTGTQVDPLVAASWNSAHFSMCSDTAPGGGAGRLYCFATN
jgi:hypothetical protein